MNRFDRENWDGAREAALAAYTYARARADVPAGVRLLVDRLLNATAEKRDPYFRDAIEVTSGVPLGAVPEFGGDWHPTLPFHCAT